MTRERDPNLVRSAEVEDGMGEVDTAGAAEFDDFPEVPPEPIAYELVRRYPDDDVIRHREQVRFHASPEAARSWLVGLAQAGAARMGADYGVWSVVPVYS